jgi:hypothetical protein
MHTNPVTPDPDADPAGRSLRRRAPAGLAALAASGVAVLALVTASGADAAPPKTATVKAAVKRDVLTVTGTSAAEAITLRLRVDDPSTLEVDVANDGTADFSFDRSRFSSIIVRGAAGDDILAASHLHGVFTDTEATTLDGGDGTDRLTGSFGPERLSGGRGDDFLDGNQGADTVDGGDGADVVQWDPGDGSDVITGGTGIDRLAFNASNASDVLDVSANAGRVRLTRNIGTITLDLDDIETADLRLLGGNDVLTVGDLTGTDLSDVRADLGSSTGAPDALTDDVVVDGTGGDDAISVVDEGQAVRVDGLSATVRVTKTDPTLDRLTVRGLAGDDSITATPGAHALMLLDLLP